MNLNKISIPFKTLFFIHLEEMYYSESSIYEN